MVYIVGHFLTSQTRQLTATVIYMQVPLQKKYAGDQKKFLQEIRIPADVHQPTASPRAEGKWKRKTLSDALNICKSSSPETVKPVWQQNKQQIGFTRVLSTLPTGSLPVIPVQFSSCLLQTNPPALLPGWGMINIASSRGSQTFLVRNLPGKQSSTSRSVFTTGSCPCLAL